MIIHTSPKVRRLEEKLLLKQIKKSIPDKTAEYGPPDRPCNFQSTSSSLKRKSTSICDSPVKKNAISPYKSFTPNKHSDVLGKSVQMKFETDNSTEWFDGIIVSYNGLTEKYGIYIPCEKQTVETYIDDEDMNLQLK